MLGFFNRLLRIDLSSQTFTVQPIPDDVLANHLGGKGLAATILVDNTPVGVDPLAPENPLVVAIGPAAGTLLAPASRYGLFAKSPLTGIFGESYAGGHVAPQMSATGFDAILLCGAAEQPVYLEISDQGVVFHNASSFWGMDALEAEQALQTDVNVPGARAIVIGPAGENQLPFAVVSNDEGHQAGRTGMGAIMGAKRVKGMVFHGQAQRALYDPDGIREYDRQLRARGKTNAGVKAYRAFGTPMTVGFAAQAMSFPSYYWTAGTVPHWEQIGGDMLVERFKPRSISCHRCFFGCRKMTTVPDGRHAGLTLQGPEYETIFAFGGLCAVDDLAEIIYLNDVCDRLGLDTITAGNLAGFAIEASRRGAIDSGLDYGDVDGIAELLHQIASKEGLGATLAPGARAASRELGLENLAIHVKGMEPPGYDPRTLKGMGLAFAVSDRGACHLRATVYKAEFSGLSDPASVAGKADLLLDFEDRHTLFDVLIFCRFYRDMIGWDDLPVVIRGLTGLELDKADLQRMSARIADTIRGFNLREGMTPADDTLPERFLQEPLEPGGERLTSDELQQMVNEYYGLRGWTASP
jgi:aldehyde:ferredoxin oxidoreductase